MANGSTPVTATVNPVVKFVNDVLDILLDTGVDAAQAYATAHAPFLAYPVIKDIFNSLLKLFKVVIEIKIGQRVDNIIIKAQQDAKNAAYKEAEDHFKTVEANLNSTIAEKDAALAAMKAQIDNLVHQHKAAT